jgi:hypothetical protein
MDRSELPLEPRHVGEPSNASKMIYEPMVHLTQTEHLSCTDANTISKWIETRFHMTHVTEEFHRVRLKWFPSQWYVQCKPCTYLASRLALSPNRSNQASIEPHHLGVPFCVSKMISEPMVRSLETVHPSCIDINTVYKLTKRRHQMTHVT